jgi:hypothetical protein
LSNLRRHFSRFLLRLILRSITHQRLFCTSLGSGRCLIISGQGSGSRLPGGTLNRFCQLGLRISCHRFKVLAGNFSGHIRGICFVAELTLPTTSRPAELFCCLHCWCTSIRRSTTLCRILSARYRIGRSCTFSSRRRI